MTDSAGVPPRADLVLPCPDEAEALPWVPARVPAACRAVVADTPEDAERVAASAPATDCADALHAGRGPRFLRRSDGWLLPLEVERWCAGAGAADATVLARPGRPAPGVDVTPEAVDERVGVHVEDGSGGRGLDTSGHLERRGPRLRATAALSVHRGEGRAADAVSRQPLG